MSKVIILLDNRGDFRTEVEVQGAIDDYPFVISCADTVESAVALYKNSGASLLLLSDEAMMRVINEGKQQLISESNGVKAAGYATNEKGTQLFIQSGMKHIGQVKTADDLYGKFSKRSAPESAQNTQPQKAAPVTQAPAYNQVPQAPYMPPAPPVMPQQPMQQDFMQQTHQVTPPVQQAAAAPGGMDPTAMMAMFQQFMAMQQAGTQNPGQPTVAAVNQQPPQHFQQMQEDDLFDEIEQGAASPAPRNLRQRHNQNVKEELDRQVVAEATSGRPKEKKAEVITSYSAKGGVGKTSIAKELAVMLACTSNGRRKYKVAIVDCNVDFGDIVSTLDLDPKGPNMAHWVMDIQERREGGESHEGMAFSSDEIFEAYLQKYNGIELYALIAPVTHEDSMSIDWECMQVMLDNLVNRCGFDYVICDTGNNTRDSSIIALEMADKVLLIATQDVTTANCNDAFLNAMRKVGGLDNEKVSLIVNNVMPAKETGISTSEVEEVFSYPCVSRIKRTPEIIKANNEGRPLVFNQKSTFTKSIYDIVRYITAGEVIEEEQPKGLFGKKKSKKKK